MNILGIGCDIVEVTRVKDLINKHGDSFLSYMFSKNEIEYSLKNGNQELSLAARIAGKESVVKAFKTGISECISWLDIEILNEQNGAPFVKISDKSRLLLPKFKNILISLSHEKNYAIAYVIITI